MWLSGVCASNEESFEFCSTALLCPFVGYLEFLHIDWLRQILSWQTSFGCWGSAQHSMENVLTRIKSANKAVRQKKEEAGYQHYPLKVQSNSAVGDFMIKRDGMKRLQEFDPEMIKQFQRLRHEQELNRTIRKRRFRYGVTLMTTVFVRRRPPRNQGAEKTTERLGFLNESLLLTETSDRVHSPLPLPLPGKYRIRSSVIALMSSDKILALFALISKLKAL